MIIEMSIEKCHDIISAYRRRLTDRKKTGCFQQFFQRCISGPIGDGTIYACLCMSKVTLN